MRLAGGLAQRGVCPLNGPLKNPLSHWTDATVDELAGVLWPVAHSATELLVSGPLRRVRGCGTPARMRRYVARRAAKRKS